MVLRTILIVKDELPVAQGYVTFLKSKGFECNIAGSLADVFA